MKFKVISDGSLDISEELIKQHQIEVIPFYISMNGENYQKERVEIATMDIYKQMVDNPNLFPKTSMITINDYVSTFTRFAEKNIDILYITLSSKFTNSSSSAYLAREEVLKKYPNVKIEILDSTLATCVQGLFVLEAARMSENNLELSVAIKLLINIRSTGNIYFMVGNLEYLRHGGRIGKLAGVIGATLKVRPIIGLGDGELYSLGVAFTKNQGIAKVVAQFKKYFDDPNHHIEDYIFVVGSGYDIEDGIKLRQKFMNMYPNVEFMLGQIGATIGVHTGPHPLGVGFIKKYDA